MPLVELQDSRTQKYFYANTETGQCAWERPEGAEIKSSFADDEWWELLDSKRQKNYYYHVNSKTTQWKKPENANIITLVQVQNAAEVRDSIPTCPVEQTDNSEYDLVEYAKKYFNMHRKGIFRKKVPIERMLQWQKEPLHKPLLILKKNLRKEGLQCFKLIQRITSSKYPKESRIKDLGVLLEKGIMTGGLRDEIYLQICKQLSNNPDKSTEETSSLYMGWQLFCVIAVAFPPSKSLELYIRAFIQNGPKQGSLKQLTEYALKVFDRILKSGPRGKGLSIAEIERALVAPFSSSVFGETLQDIMQEHKDRNVPQILEFLTQAVLEMGGCKTEGIFRVPGDVDGVNELRCRIESGKYDCSGISDPNVPSSLLKLWLRELADPIIPAEFYNECIAIGGSESATDAEKAAFVVEKLPDLNKRVLKFTVNFLKIVGNEENHKYTKMTLANIAMVFAPNFLRCPSDNPAVIFENTK